jgi:8-oxo-dGTP pyrophosphatase MutT (NUDIX family)
MVDLLRTRTPKRLGDLDPRVVEPKAPLRPAAVVVLLERTEGYGVVLTKRSHAVEHHKGEISLAGGMRDADDASLEATALRELDEEIGVPPAAVRVLGRLDDIATVTGFLVTPFVCAIDAAWPMRLQSGEVERVLHVPMRVLRDPAAWFDDIRTWRGDTYHLRSCRFGDDIIWGATSRILQHFLAVIPTDVL